MFDLIIDYGQIKFLTEYKNYLYYASISIALYVILNSELKKVSKMKNQNIGKSKRPSENLNEMSASSDENQSLINIEKSEVEIIKRLQSATKIGSWELDINSETLTISDEASKLLGIHYDSHFVKLQQIMHIFCIDDREMIRANLDRLKCEKGQFNTQLRIIDPKTGANKIIKVTGNFENDFSGHPKKLIGIVKDITGESIGREIQEKYALLSMHTRDIILFILEDGRIIDANQAATQIYGYTYHEITNMNIKDLRHPDFSSMLSDQFNAAMEDGIIFETVHRKKDGGLIPVEVSSKSAVLNNKTIIISIIRDITERKNIEKSLIESEQRFREIAETINDVFWVNENGRLVYISPAYEWVWGRDSQELIKGAYSFLDTVHPEDKAEISRKYADNENDPKEGTVIQQYRIIRPDGDIRWINSKRYPIVDASGKRVRTIGISQDITDLKKSEEMLKIAKVKADEANLAKSIFVANMSHEIRTPMNGMLGMIQLAQMSVTKEERDEYLQLAKKSSDSLLEIINDILDYSKIESGKMILGKEKINVREIVNEVIKLFSYTASQKNIVISYNEGKEIPEYLYGDKMRLRQVISNLIGNAVKFTDYGKVSVYTEVISSTHSTSQIKFTVEDTGIGISNKSIKRIFESFIQADVSLTKNYGGTGLGLAISKKIIEAMDGDLKVESEEGKGSRFYFTVTFENMVEAKDQVNTEQKYESCVEVDIYKNKRVLVVENDKINHIVLTKLLSNAGMHSTLAEDGLEAINKYKNGDFDIILMDIQMPKMDGITATSIIRSLEFDTKKRVPIIALTAYALNTDKDRFIKAGMDDYLSKPIDAKILLNTIIKWVVTKK